MPGGPKWASGEWRWGDEANMPRVGGGDMYVGDWAVHVVSLPGMLATTSRRHSARHRGTTPLSTAGPGTPLRHSPTVALHAASRHGVVVTWESCWARTAGVWGDGQLGVGIPVLGRDGVGIFASLGPTRCGSWASLLGRPSGERVRWAHASVEMDAGSRPLGASEGLLSRVPPRFGPASEIGGF